MLFGGKYLRAQPAALIKNFTAENAALPHGTGSDRILGKHDLALFDTGGSLHGYSSDVTRTLALSDSAISPRHLEIWFLVSAAQSAAIKTARIGAVTSSVDAVARNLIGAGGNGAYFTHRLGHGELDFVD